MGNKHQKKGPDCVFLDFRKGRLPRTKELSLELGHEIGLCPQKGRKYILMEGTETQCDFPICNYH